MRLHRSGFSLVLSLTIMAAMVLMVIVLASFLQVESRLAQSHAGYLRARFNALASARMAVGQLQMLAGPDQRVTMRADMYADNDGAVGNNDGPSIQQRQGRADRTNNNAPAGGRISHQKRYLTGVWATGGVDPTRARDWDVTNPADSRLFLGWLASPFGVNVDPEISAPAPNYLPTTANFTTAGNFRQARAAGPEADGQALINDLGTPIDNNPALLVPLVSFGTLNLPTGLTGMQRNYLGAIDARPQPLPGPAYTDGTTAGANGRYAFWIGDEGVKAKVNLPDHYAATTGGAWLSPEPWDRGFAASANQRNAIAAIGAPGEILREGVNPRGTLPGNFNFEVWRNKDVVDAAGNPQAYQLAKAVGSSGLAAWAVRQGGLAAGQAMSEATRLLWHDVTTHSFSTLTDTYNGGVKIDLSTAFELPYAMYRGIEVYPGQKDPALVSDARLRKQSLFHNSPNAHSSVAGLGTNGMAVDLDYNRPNLVDKLGSAGDLLMASPRASEWAPRYLSSLLGNSYTQIRARNGGTGTAPGPFSETPERLGFVYEAPLRSAFFDDYTQNANNVSRLLVNTERSPNATENRVGLTNWYGAGVVTNANNALTPRINALPWSELVEGHPENLNGRIVRGPTWDLYRNYYRMYKREVEQAGRSSSGALRGQPAAPADAVVARGVEPLSYATGNRNEPMQRGRQVNSGSPAPWSVALRPDQFYSGGGQLNANRYYYRNNLSAPSDTPSFQAEQRLRYPNILAHNYVGTQSLGLNFVTNFDRMGLAQPRPASGDAYYNLSGNFPETTTRTWPTSMSLAPSIVRFSMIFSGVFSDPTSADLNGTLGVTVDPVVMVHNPYDVAIEFEGLAMVTNGESLPYIFDVQIQDWTFADTHWQYFDPNPASPRTQRDPRPRNLTDPLWVGEVRQRDLTIGEVALGDGAQENRSFSFRLVNPGGKFRLEPGEVKTISTKFLGGDYRSNRASNTVIATNDFGYDLGSNAVYKMTPFYNVRYRRGGDVSTQLEEGGPGLPNPDGRLWTWGFMPGRPGDGKLYVLPPPTGLGQAPAHGFFGGYCYNGIAGADNPSAFHNAIDLWNDVKNSRRLRDAFGVDWDGTARKLKTVLQFAAPVNQGRNVRFVVRNSGWVAYDNRIVGEEGVPNTPGYVFPRLRNGTTAVGGHQHWNFYLLNNRSIDGQALNKDRRWFGSPTSANPNYNPTAKTVTGYAYEGSGTAPGQHLVDESLLLNFQALTAGWPLYGNDNGHWSNIIQFNEQWMSGLPNVPAGRPRTPDYRIPTGRPIASHTGVLWRGDTNVLGQQVTYGPENGDPELGRPEITSGHRAGSLNGRVVASVRADRGDDKQPFFMTDFLLRSAEMTGQTRDIWYPANNGSASANFRINVDNNRRLETPAEVFNAPMSPFFLSVRPQQAHLYGYDGKAHTPIGWVLSQRGLDDDPQMALSANNINAYWGASVSPGISQRSDTVLFPIPRRPLLSLAQLGSAGFAQVNTDADLTVGSSFAHPGIMDLTKVTDWPGPKRETGSDAAIPENGYVGIHEGTRIIRNVANVRTDHAFVANLALWDAYYFSGLNLQANSYSLPGERNPFPTGPDLATDPDVADDQAASLRRAAGSPSVFDPTSFREIKAALEAGFNPLANKRVVFQSDARPAVADGTFPAANDFPHPTYLARNSLYDGGFNVNSTSKAAWKAVLAGMRGQTLPDGTAASGTVLTRFARSFRPAGGAIGPWNNYRELTDLEIDRLAAEVVKEVRDRGPFMSLADFVNRRLLDSNDAALRQHGLKGALQAAIDRSGINNSAIRDAGGNLSDGTFNAPAAPTLLASFTDPIGGIGRGAPNFTDKNGNGPGVWGVLRNTTNATAPRFPNLASMSQQVQTQQQPQPQGSAGAQRVTAGLGAPQIVTQMDVLNTVGPNLTPRSDTFTIRAYGEALDNSGNTIGRAWVEVVVQRGTQMMIPAARGPAYEEINRRRLNYRANLNREYDLIPMLDQYESLYVSGAVPARLPANATATERENWNVNRLLGRRFKATSIRWLNANEI